MQGKHVFSLSRPSTSEMKARRLLVLCSSIVLLLAVSAQAQLSVPDRAAEVDDFFFKSDLTINFDPSFDPDGDFAIHVADGVGLFVDFENVVLNGAITLHPNTFVGGAVLASDWAALNAVYVNATQVSQVVTNETQYRELCAFDHRVGGPNIAGTIQVTLGDGNSEAETVELAAEVGTSMIGFDTIEGATNEAADEGGGLVISWPNKYCRGVKIQWKRCLPFTCGMTLGDMIDLAGQAGLTIPTSVIAGGVDMVAGWLGAQGYAVSGTCGEVEFAWLIPLGCQCIYVQF